MEAKKEKKEAVKIDKETLVIHGIRLPKEVSDKLVEYNLKRGGLYV